jgi:hypothetical protein
MTTSPPALSGSVVPLLDPLQMPVAAYLARFKGLCRQHTQSDLRIFVGWCIERGLDPLTAHRVHLELFVR